MTEIVKEAAKAVSERLSSPFFFPFLFSWLGANYVLVFIAISDLGVDEKILRIGQYRHETPWATLVGLPLGFVGLYVFALPYLSVASAFVAGNVKNWVKRAEMFWWRREPRDADEVAALCDEVERYRNSLKESQTGQRISIQTIYDREQKVKTAIRQVDTLLAGVPAEFQREVSSVRDLLVGIV